MDIPCLGVMALSPSAPALAQREASSLIFVSRAFTDGRAPLKTQSLQCFHIIQGTRVMVPRPLRMGVAADCHADCHQSRSEGSLSGGAHSIPSMVTK